MLSVRALTLRATLAAAIGLAAAPASPELGAQPLPRGQESGCTPDPRARATSSSGCILLIPTRHAAGVSGVVRMALAPSPFAVTVTPDGRYVYRLEVRIAGLPHTPDAEHVAWVATPDLSQRKRLGTVAEDGTVRGTVDWNKFMIVVTAEPGARGREGADPGDGGAADRDPDGAAADEGWRGPVLLSATSPSGRLKTMAGEEIFGNNELPVGSRYCLMNEC